MGRWDLLTTSVGPWHVGHQANGFTRNVPKRLHPIRELATDIFTPGARARQAAQETPQAVSQPQS
ncbi:hypothetical protein ACIQF5_22080 [Streptomyces goshikiensis]|uniref:hypothetical protein n=1 Tax=Streptomyces goshikiensis TaxID=1942 RepID=UPI00380F5F64